MQIDYNSLSLDQLKEIKKNSELAIADYQTRQRKEAVAKATEIAKAAGFSSLENMLAAQSTKKPQWANPKYRHPENPELTWTGRGRKPAWIAEAQAAGKLLEEFAI